MGNAFDTAVHYFESVKKAVICYSGGYDSTFLIAAASKAIPGNCLAVMVDIPMLSEYQKSNAISIAEEIGIDLIVIPLSLDSMAETSNNRIDRCYFCKGSIYTAIRNTVFEMGYSVCVCGDNADDMQCDRPGAAAGRQLGIISPLADLGITRAEVEASVNALNLKSTVIKGTCLATRIPEGTVLTEDNLRLVESCEKIVRDITWIETIRFRLDGNGARIQTSEDSFKKMSESMNQINNKLKNFGISAILDPKKYQ